jgi:hypothetical protein
MVVHWYIVTQLCFPVPIVSNQSQFNSWWYTGTLSHNFVFQCLLSPTKVNLIHGGTLVHSHTTQYFSTHCFQPNAVYIVMEHRYTVTQLCFPVPTVSSQSQFNSWWYTGTLSHNSVFINTLLSNKCNFYCGGTLVHCHMTLFSSAYCHKKSQFNSWWYTGTLSHNSELLNTLITTKCSLYCGGTLVHCHTALFPSAYCLQTKSI